MEFGRYLQELTVRGYGDQSNRGGDKIVTRFTLLDDNLFHNNTELCGTLNPGPHHKCVSKSPRTVKNNLNLVNHEIIPAFMIPGYTG